MQTPTRLIIADPGLSGPAGHHLGYSQSVAEAALARGIACLVLAGKSFDGRLGDGAITCRASFGARYRTSGGGGRARRAILGMAARLPPAIAAGVAPTLRQARRSLRRYAATPDGFGIELAAALLSARSGAQDLVLMHSVSAANLAGLPGALRPDAVGGVAVVLRRLPAEMDSDDFGPQPVASILRRLAVHFGERLHLFADTEPLAAMYAGLVPVPVWTLPLPTATPPLTVREAGLTSHLVYAGGARAEKGYALLPPLVERLGDNARITIHSGTVDAAADPVVQRAHRALLGLASPNVVLLEHALDPPDYMALLASADMLLLPYDAVAYGPRSSGILSEARALGIPAIVPRGCWLADAAGPAREVVFDGAGDFVATVERALTLLPTLGAMLREAAPEWRRMHSPDALLEVLLSKVTGSGGPQGRLAAIVPASDALV